VDVGTSVSRVGGKTQAAALRLASQALRLDYAQFLELEVFTRFGGMSDARVKDKIARGHRMRAALAQPQFTPLRLACEVALILALQEGLLDRLPAERVANFRAQLPGWLDRSASGVADRIDRLGELSEADGAELRTALEGLVDNLTRQASAQPERA
jgi:F-type H+-transporting ATPase subunit alpha